MKRLVTAVMMALFAMTSVYALAADEPTTPPAKEKKHSKKHHKTKKEMKHDEGTAAPAQPAAPKQ